MNPNITDIASLGMTDEEIKNTFIVSIFGSARTQPDDPVYQKTYALAKHLAQQGVGVVTGGGPGIMEAANKGHAEGDPDGKSPSIGLTIHLPMEAEGNDYLDAEKHFMKFGGRLDTFMKLSDAVVVMPGGIGTCLELFYTWQLIQVQHICNIPIICVGEQWKGLVDWVRSDLLSRGMIAEKDMDMVVVARDTAHACEILSNVQKAFNERDGDYCMNVHKYA